MKAIEKIKKMSLTQKVLLLIGCLLVVLLLCKAGQVVFKKSNSNNLRQASVVVVLSLVKNGLIRDIGQFSGTLISKSQFAVAPKVSGKLKKLYVNIGDRVTRGEIVAQLDDEEYLQQVAQAEADLKVARANFEEARSALELADLSGFVVFLGLHLLQNGMSIILPETGEQSDSPQKEGKPSAPRR